MKNYQNLKIKMMNLQEKIINFMILEKIIYQKKKKQNKILQEYKINLKNLMINKEASKKYKMLLIY